MKICMLYTAAEAPFAERFNFLRGRLSYSADVNRLRSEKLSPDADGDIMIVSCDAAGEHISAAIYDECRRRKYSGVFLDSNRFSSEETRYAFSEISSSLTRKELTVFCPLDYAQVCPDAIPVAEACVSGGSFEEYISQLTRRHKRLALSIPRTITLFTMPALGMSGKEISTQELSLMIDRHDAETYYSTQMLTNYFIFSTASGDAGYVLFDNARSISEKMRIAKRLGIGTVFIAYRELADIYGESIH